MLTLTRRSTPDVTTVRGLSTKCIHTMGSVWASHEPILGQNGPRLLWVLLTRSFVSERLCIFRSVVSVTIGRWLHLLSSAASSSAQTSSCPPTLNPHLHQSHRNTYELQTCGARGYPCWESTRLPVELPDGSDVCAKRRGHQTVTSGTRSSTQPGRSRYPLHARVDRPLRVCEFR